MENVDGPFTMGWECIQAFSSLTFLPDATAFHSDSVSSYVVFFTAAMQHTETELHLRGFLTDVATTSIRICNLSCVELYAPYFRVHSSERMIQ